MGVASMDTFMKALLVERSSHVVSTSPSSAASCGDGVTLGQESCVVVVDNAHFHKERWSQLPRKFRNHLMKSDHASRRVMTNNSNINTDSPTSITRDSVTSRWMSMDESPRSQKKPGSCERSAIPAPPSIPQRQQSIEVQQQQQQSTSATAAPVRALMASVQEECTPRMPERRTSVVIGSSNTNHPVMSSAAVPEKDIPRMPKRRSSVVTTSSSSSVRADMDPVPEDDGLRMPERQASDPSYDFAAYGITKTPVECPPPRRSVSSDNNGRGDDEPLRLGGTSFGQVIKRTRASLLDDDGDSDDDDDEMELYHPHLILQALQTF